MKESAQLGTNIQPFEPSTTPSLLVESREEEAASSKEGVSFSSSWEKHWDWRSLLDSSFPRAGDFREVSEVDLSLRGANDSWSPEGYR